MQALDPIGYDWYSVLCIHNSSSENTYIICCQGCFDFVWAVLHVHQLLNAIGTHKYHHWYELWEIGLLKMSNYVMVKWFLKLTWHDSICYNRIEWMNMSKKLANQVEKMFALEMFSNINRYLQISLEACIVQILVLKLVSNHDEEIVVGLRCLRRGFPWCWDYQC